VVIASSSSVYGDNTKDLLCEDDNLIIKPPTDPISIYAVSKLADEVIGLSYYHTADIPVISARIFNTIGPRQIGLYGMVVPRFIHQACNNEPITVFGDGTQSRSFCDVRDTVEALDTLASHPKAIGEIFNVGNDREISINELAALVRQRSGNNVEIQHVPYHVAYGVAFTDIARRRPDLSKLINTIHFKHKWSLDDTIKDLIAHYSSD
jgi:UDP-glucose 4-epimerase